MPLQVLPSQPVTGYAQLGQVIANAGDRYAQTVRQDELMALARANQLADVADARTVARTEGDRTWQRSRDAQLADVGAARAREDAQRAESRGFQLDDREDARMYAESAAYAEHARKLKEILPDKNNAQRLVDDAATQLSAVRQRAQDVSQRITSQPQQVGPNDPAVMNLAQQLAGGSRKREEIAAMVPKALEQINGEAMVRHAQGVRASQEVLQSLRDTERQLTDLIQQGMTSFRVAPNVPPPTGGAGLTGPDVMGAAPAPMLTIGASGLAGALNQALGGNAPAGGGGGAQPAPIGGALMDNPTANPAIAAGNNELRAREQAQLNAAISRRDAIQRQLQAPAVSAPNPTLGVGLGGMTVGSFTNPLATAEAATADLKALAAAEADVKRLQMQVMGPTAGGVTLPATNTATGSTPRAPWFQMMQPLPVE